VQSIYAGYVAWRGTLNEADAPKELVRFFEDAFTFSEARSGGHILTYFIPGAGADTTLGRRRLNWVWYVAADQDELGPLLIDRDGRQHHASLPQGRRRLSIAPGTRFTRSSPNSWQQRLIRLCRRSSMWLCRAPSSAGSAFLGTLRS
jgi:hypothetical protein